MATAIPTTNSVIALVAGPFLPAGVPVLLALLGLAVMWRGTGTKAAA